MDLTHLLNAAVGLLISGGLWMLKDIKADIKAKFEAQDKTLEEQSTQLTTISTVLMGPTGENGLRSDVREATRAIVTLNTRLDKAGVD